MLENIQETFLLLWVVSMALIITLKSEDIHLWLASAILGVWFISTVGGFVTTLMVIWA